MPASYADLLSTLRDGTTRVLRTDSEVAALITAQKLLTTHYHSRFASPWEVPRLLCAVIRTQLNARRTATQTDDADGLLSVSLLQLLAATWRLCPLLTLPQPSAVSSSTHARAGTMPLFSEGEMDRVAEELEGLQAAATAAELASPCVSSSELKCVPPHPAPSVLLSLLTYWHALSADLDSALAFQEVSAAVWYCAVRWTVASAHRGARPLFHSSWLSTVLRRSLQVPEATELFFTVEWLEALWASTSSSTEPLNAPKSMRSPALDAAWVRFHVRVLKCVSAVLQEKQTAMKAHWSSAIGPILQRAFRHEPALLSAAFSRAVDFATPLHSSLGVLCEWVRNLNGLSSTTSTESLPLVCTSTVEPLLHLARLQKLVDGVGITIAPFITASTYVTCVKPVVSVCLRWGLVEEAQMLLDWSTESLDSHGIEWQTRLQRQTPSTQQILKAPPIAMKEGCLYASWHLQCAAEQPWCACEVMDALVCSHLLEELRPIADGLLRWPAPWTVKVLQDPYTPLFVASGLARLGHTLLDAGDAPLARWYTTLLGQLLPQLPCPPAIPQLIRLLRRLADVLSAQRVSPCHFAVSTSAHGQGIAGWRAILHYLDSALPNFREEHSGDCVPGAAMSARQHFHDHCHFLAHAATAQDTHHIVISSSAFTVVEVAYGTAPDGAGTLSLRCIDSETLLGLREKEESLSYACCCCTWLVGEAVRACAAELSEVMHANRAQLMAGNTAVGAAESGRCVDSQGSLYASQAPFKEADTDHIQPSAEPSLPTQKVHIHHSVKEAWWRERFALDTRVQKVTSALQLALGPAQALLVGRPRPLLTTRLHSLAIHFAEECVRLCGEKPHPPLPTLRDVTLRVLLGATFLWSTGDGEGDESTCVFGATYSGECSLCSATVRRARHTVLPSIVDLGQRTANSSDFHFSSDEERVDAAAELWEHLLIEEALAPAVETMVDSTLDAYYTECSQHVSTSLTPPTHQHVNLLLHAREHVYLVLGSDLHALPWESLLPLQERSVSRVPSIAHLRRSLRTLDGQTASVRRTLLYQESESVTGGSALTTMAAQHPSWEMAHGATLQAATNALDSDSSTCATPLLRRLLSPASHRDHIDLYIYAGHKGGEQLVPRGTLYEFIPYEPTPTLALLMGCSSARMAGNHRYDAFGLPHAYLSAGVAAMVGCLWDVTDGDVDRLTCRIIDGALRIAQPMTIGELVAVARRACKLRYLTGVSVVLYGVNLPVEAGIKEDNRARTV